MLMTDSASLCHSLVLFHPLPCFRRLQPPPCNLASADVEAIPDVNRPDGKKQPGQRLLVVMPGGLIPDFIGDRIRAVAEPCHSFREGQRCTFGICKVRCVTPDGYGEKALIRFAGLPDLTGVHVHADAAAVDLAGTKFDKAKRGLGHSALLHG